MYIFVVIYIYICICICFRSEVENSKTSICANMACPHPGNPWELHGPNGPRFGNTASQEEREVHNGAGLAQKNGGEKQKTCWTYLEIMKNLIYIYIYILYSINYIFIYIYHIIYIYMHLYSINYIYYIMLYKFYLSYIYVILYKL